MVEVECAGAQRLTHDHGIRTSGTGNHRVFTDANGRAITTDQPHAPPG